MRRSRPCEHGGQNHRRGGWRAAKAVGWTVLDPKSWSCLVVVKCCLSSVPSAGAHVRHAREWGEGASKRTKGACICNIVIGADTQLGACHVTHA